MYYLDGYRLIEQTTDFLVVASPVNQPCSLSRLPLVSQDDYQVIEAGSSRFEMWCARVLARIQKRGFLMERLRNASLTSCKPT
jgi:hypothetical protein